MILACFIHKQLVNKRQVYSAGGYFIRPNCQKNIHKKAPLRFPAIIPCNYTNAPLLYQWLASYLLVNYGSMPASGAASPRLLETGDAESAI